MNNIFILEKVKKKDEFYFFEHQFINAYIKSDGKSIHPLKSQRYLGFLCRKLNISSSIFKSNKKLIVCTCANCLLADSLPYSLNYEIIPMLWDCWPVYWDKLIEYLIKLKVRVVFVSSSQVAKMLNERLPSIHSYYIPEGIDPKVYNKGTVLNERPYELYELGRIYEPYHKKVVSMIANKKIVHHFYTIHKSNGENEKLAFPTYEDLINNLSKIKIVISFPQNITNSQKAGDVETLTQRYWESMLSRNIIVGKAPKELIEIIGYDPVVDANMLNPSSQIISILDNINDYQNLVDRNYDAAIKYSSWMNRMNSIKEILEKEF